MMADIKLTLAEDKRRAPSIEAEARRLQDEGWLYYPIQGQPVRAKPGCWVYFIRGDHMVARAEAENFERSENATSLYDGTPLPAGKWMVKCIPPMEIARRRPPHKGFQGFRYVAGSDGFADAFD